MIFHLALLAVLQQQVPATTPDKSYLFFVASEGGDEVALLRFGPKGLLVEHRTPVRVAPGDPAAPRESFTERYSGLNADSLSGVHRTYSLSSAHGLSSAYLRNGPRNVSLGPDGRSYYVTTAHGLPAGELLKLQISSDSGFRLQYLERLVPRTVGNVTDTIRVPFVDTVRLSQSADTVRGRESFETVPGAVQVTRDGAYAWVTHSASGAKPQPAWVAVVYLSAMLEVARIPTCGAPRGSRLTSDDARHYSVCMLDDVLVEIDARAMKVSRKLTLSDSAGHSCAPVALTMLADGSRLYVSCSRSNDVVEVDAGRWLVTRRFAVNGSPGELAVTADGRLLVVANETSAAVSVLELTGATAPVGPVAKVAISPGNRFAYHAPARSETDARRVDVFDISGMIIAAGFFAMPLDQSGARAVTMLADRGGTPASVAISADDRYAFVSVARSDEDVGTVEVIDLGARTVVGTIEFGRHLAGIAFWKTSK